MRMSALTVSRARWTSVRCTLSRGRNATDAQRCFDMYPQHTLPDAEHKAAMVACAELVGGHQTQPRAARTASPAGSALHLLQGVVPGVTLDAEAVQVRLRDLVRSRATMLATARVAVAQGKLLVKRIESEVEVARQLYNQWAARQ